MIAFCFTYIFLAAVMCVFGYFRAVRMEDLPIEIEARDCENDLEYALRALMRKYPRSEINVYYEPSCDGTLEILQKMSADYPRIVICSNDDFSSFSPTPVSKVRL